MNKQQTLEESGSVYAETVDENHTSHMLGFYNGAKWQAKQDAEEIAMYQLAIERQEARFKVLRDIINDLQSRMFTEEEVHKIIEDYQNNVENNPTYITYYKWFEQFKKK